MKPVSCGFLISSKGKYLICHTTQDPDYKYSDKDPFWSIPKGIPESEETYLETAIRETEEETGLNILSYFKPSEIKKFRVFKSNHKEYHIFLVNDKTGKLLNFNFNCSSLIENKKFPNRNGLPEHDIFKWVDKKEGKDLVFKSLKHIFDLI